MVMEMKAVSARDYIKLDAEVVVRKTAAGWTLEVYDKDSSQYFGLPLSESQVRGIERRFANTHMQCGLPRVHKTPQQLLTESLEKADKS